MLAFHHHRTAPPLLAAVHQVASDSFHSMLEHRQLDRELVANVQQHLARVEQLGTGQEGDVLAYCLAMLCGLAEQSITCQAQVSMHGDFKR